MAQTSSYDVENDTGAAVRGRINQIIAALVSSGAGTTPPTDTEPGMLWWDTSVNPPALKIRNLANTEFVDFLDGDGAKIKLKRSAVAGVAPTTGQIDLGELFANTKDGKLFLKRSDGTEEIVEVGARWGNFTAEANGTKLNIKYNGAAIMSLDGSGNLAVIGNVTGYSSGV